MTTVIVHARVHVLKPMIMIDHRHPNGDMCMHAFVYMHEIVHVQS